MYCLILNCIIPHRINIASALFVSEILGITAIDIQVFSIFILDSHNICKLFNEK
ncbi:UNVERIFIED_CONTAM: hypothetical protein QE387_000064 [Pseudacidovorax intermedius]|nr:hypothetical protein [Chryseobacterium sp. SORGH_AS_1175]MDT3405747.1 hypothetical protein [Pseudacidovorax intermedius]